MSWQRVDAYAWRADNGYRICRFMTGAGWCYWVWPPRVTRWPTVEQINRAVARVNSLQTAIDIAETHAMRERTKGTS